VPLGQQAFDQTVQVGRGQGGQFVVRQRAQERRGLPIPIVLSQGAGNRAEILLRVLTLDQDDLLQFVQRFGIGRGARQQFDQQRPRGREVFVQPAQTDRRLVFTGADGKVGSEQIGRAHV